MHWNSPKGLPTSSGMIPCNCVHSGDPELPKPPTLNTSTLELVHLDYQHASPTSGTIMRYSSMPHHSCSRSSRSGHISGIRRYPESPESSDSPRNVRYYALSTPLPFMHPLSLLIYCFNALITSPCYLFICFTLPSHSHHSPSLLHLPQGRCHSTYILSLFYPSVHLSNHMLYLSPFLLPIIPYSHFIPFPAWWCLLPCGSLHFMLLHIASCYLFPFVQITCP